MGSLVTDWRPRPHGLRELNAAGAFATRRAIPAALRLGRMKEATLKHFVERLRPVFDEGRSAASRVGRAPAARPGGRAIDMKRRVNAHRGGDRRLNPHPYGPCHMSAARCCKIR
jgi:hypothetical protein